LNIIANNDMKYLTSHSQKNIYERQESSS